MLPDSYLLQGSDQARRVYVRVTFEVQCPLGIGTETGARMWSQQVFNQAARPLAPSSYPVSQPEVYGGTFLIDFRVTKTLTVGRYKAELEGLAGSLFCKLRVTDVSDVSPEALSQSNTAGTAGQRQQTVAEAEQSRQERTITLGTIGKTVSDVFKAGRTFVIVGIIGALVYATWPLLTGGARAGARILKQRKRKGGARG